MVRTVIPSTYYVYAFWVDEQTGEPASVTAFSESPFKTEKQVISAAVAKPSLWLTDGDDWAELNPLGYGHFKGYAILGARIAPAEGAVHWYSNIYKASDIASTDDQLLASSLINSKYYMDKTSYNLSYGVEWGGDYVIVSVAVDAAGARGPVQRVAFTATRKKKPTAFCCRFFLCRREERSTVPPVRIRRRTTSSPRGSYNPQIQMFDGF